MLTDWTLYVTLKNEFKHNRYDFLEEGDRGRGQIHPLLSSYTRVIFPRVMFCLRSGKVRVWKEIHPQLLLETFLWTEVTFRVLLLMLFPRARTHIFYISLHLLFLPAPYCLTRQNFRQKTCRNL